jgi:hypothetical protein
MERVPVVLQAERTGEISVDKVWNEKDLHPSKFSTLYQSPEKM